MNINSLSLSVSKNVALLLTGIGWVLMFIITNSLLGSQGRDVAKISSLDYFIDTEHQYSIDDIQNFEQINWKTQTSHSYSPYMSAHLHWLKLPTQSLDSKENWLLEIDNPLLNIVNVWFVQNNQVIEHHRLGDAKPFFERGILHENLLLPIPTKTEPIDVYINAYSTDVIQTPFYIWSEKAYLNYETKHALIMGLLIGLMLTMGGASFLLFIATRTPFLLTFSGYVLSLILTVTTLNGLTFRYLWPDSPWFQQNAILIFGSLFISFAVTLCNQLLEVKIFCTRLNKTLNIAAGVSIAWLVISFLIPNHILLNILLCMLIASGLFIFFVICWLWRKGSIIAEFYFLAWLGFSVSCLIVSLDYIGMVELSLPVDLFLMLAATFEVLLISVILAVNQNTKNQAQVKTKAELLAKEQESTETEMLEYKVQERTLELEITLRELSDKNQELEQKNTLDALTGIRNRSYFDKKYQAEVRRSRREQTHLSVVMVDIDNFKKINDEYGHLTGDECIKMVAQILQKSLKRPSDEVCRYGGEEFALVLPSTDLDGAMILVEQLRAEIEKTVIQTDEASISITISAGIGTAITELQQPEDALLALADVQLYKAKNAGRNNIKGSFLAADN